MRIRFVTCTDYQDILDIYEYYINNTVYTFEYDTPTVAEFSKRIEFISIAFP